MECSEPQGKALLHEIDYRAPFVEGQGTELLEAVTAPIQDARHSRNLRMRIDILKPFMMVRFHYSVLLYRTLVKVTTCVFGSNASTSAIL